MLRCTAPGTRTQTVSRDEWLRSRLLELRTWPSMNTLTGRGVIDKHLTDVAASSGCHTRASSHFEETNYGLPSLIAEGATRNICCALVRALRLCKWLRLPATTSSSTIPVPRQLSQRRHQRLPFPCGRSHNSPTPRLQAGAMWCWAACSHYHFELVAVLRLGSAAGE